MLQLNNLVPAGKKRKRVGRGGSRGGTSGKGHKGQKARSGGYVRRGFEGGQMPLVRRLPKRGFTNARFQKDMKVIALEYLDKVFSDGDQITKEALVAKGILKSRDKAFKILGGVTLTKKFIIHADAFSQSALTSIKESGGQATVIKER